jgi:cell wall-associated NlpC family hydrolase
MPIKAMFFLAFLTLLFGGCASTPPAPSVTVPDDVAPFTGLPPASLPPTLREEIAFVALSLLGKPYATAGASPETGFDCSGLVAYVYRQASRLNLPRNTFDQARAGAAVPMSALEPGDLVFYNTQSRDFSHVGIYLGESRFIHAPTSGGFVRIESMRATYWTTRFNGARRIAF